MPSEDQVETPHFLSLAERDRRHRLIRQAMEEAGLDALILPASTNRWEQSMADARYVSGIGGFQTETLVVFPLDGEPTAFVFNRASWWRSVQEWVPDVRDGRNRWAQSIVERLLELKLDGGSIGISQLSGQSRTPDGVFPAGTLQRLSLGLPDAKIQDATGLMTRIRSVKSAEEVAALERAADITDKMLQSMCQTAQPGASEREAYAALVGTMLAEGGELPTLMIMGSGKPVPATRFVPSGRRLEAGDLLLGEFEARVAGYGAQIVAPIAVAHCDSEYVAVHEVAANALSAFLPRVRAGRTIGEIARDYVDLVGELSSGRCRSDLPTMHARGLGDDAPVLLSTKDVAEHEDDVLAERMIFILKPKVSNVEATRTATVGRTIEVTNDGARPLNRLPVGLMISGND